MKTVESASPDHAEVAHRRTVRIAIGLEVAGVVAQLFLARQIIQTRPHLGCGESCAFAGLGLAVMIVVLLPIVIPGTIAAVYMMVRASVLRRQYGGQLLSLLLHGAVVALSIVVIGLFVNSGKPLPVAVAPKAEPAPPSPQEEDLAGYAWASDNGVSRESDCDNGTPEFIDGCKRYAHQHPSQ